MSVALTAWFADWSATRDKRFRLPSSRKHLRRCHTNPAKTCVVCGERQISQGKSESGQYARRARMCITCYNGEG